MNANPMRPHFLIALIVLSLSLTFFIFKPFLVPLVLAAIFALMLQPLYRLILCQMQRSPGLAAFVTMLIALVCIVAPIALMTMRISGDAQRLYTSLTDGSDRSDIDTLVHYANELITPFIPSLSLSTAEVSASIDQYVKNILTWIIQNLGGAFSGVTRLVLDLFIFLMALYYLLRDGPKLKQAIIKLSPLADTDDHFIFARLELAVQSVIRGSLMIAIIQGVLTGIGFALFGVPHSILWGVTAAFSALIPGIGTSLVLAPGIAYLFIIGATSPAIGLLIWSFVAVGLIDNFLGPRLVGQGMQLHPLVILLSVFGGLMFFGAAGIFLGPLCISLLFALLSIYQQVSRQSV